MKVESLCRRCLRRPRLETPPHICSRLEDHGLRLRCAFALQIVLKERKLNACAEVLAGLCSELRISQATAIAACPSSMDPWAFHQCCLRFRIELVDGVKGAVGAAQIFCVIPSTNHQHSALHIF